MKLIAPVAIVIALLASGYAIVAGVFQHIHVRYRLTVEVDDAGTIKTGSSVIDTTYPIFPDNFVFLGAHGGQVGISGSAPTVDLGPQGLLFLTFDHWTRTPQLRRLENMQVPLCLLDDVACLPFAAYGKPVEMRGSSYSDERKALLRLLKQTGPREIPFSGLTRMARLRGDSHKLESVSPFDLATQIGSSVHLSRVTLELTDAPVTPIPNIWPEWLKADREMDGILRGGEAK